MVRLLVKLKRVFVVIDFLSPLICLDDLAAWRATRALAAAYWYLSINFDGLVSLDHLWQLQEIAVLSLFDRILASFLLNRDPNALRQVVRYIRARSNELIRIDHLREVGMELRQNVVRLLKVLLVLKGLLASGALLVLLVCLALAAVLLLLFAHGDRADRHVRCHALILEGLLLF